MQFTYINLAFAPAPDDVVINLYKVRIIIVDVNPILSYATVFRYRRPSNSEL